jgi:hypothetical protein
MSDRPPIDPPGPIWVDPETKGTLVDRWLDAYAADDNTFWASDSGHHQNVIDELIDYCQRLRAELARHGWGDMHYTPAGAPQDPAIVALLAEHPALNGRI